MYRDFTAHNTLRYVDVLQTLIHTYNQSYHRSIGMASHQVTEKTVLEVWDKLYGQCLDQKTPPPKCQVGDRVRLNKIVGFQPDQGILRRKQKTPRKKRVRLLDQIQAEASRPRASYTPPQLDEADIMTFINKKAARQRRAKVNRMAGVAFGQQALRSYTAAQKKQRRRASRHPPM